MKTTMTKRRGAILLVVLVLLALFAVIGIAFVLFAQSEATNARIHREIGTVVVEPPDPTAPANFFLQQLIYPVPQGGANISSALRGHELARTAFGYDPLSVTVNQGVNTNAYNGIGAFSEPVNATPYAINNSSNTPTSLGSAAINRRQMINYSGMFANDTILDPEFTGSRNASQGASSLPNAGTQRFVGKNANYTYPDINNAYLGMMDPATGLVVVPSFHRPALFAAGGGLPPGRSDLDSANQNWTNAQGRYMILRPRPADHVYDSQDGRGPVSDFPYPPANPDGTITGDVQNMRWANNVQKNDSVWIHANLPPVEFRGRKVQPLVAALILPMDGRVNMNIAGNRRNSGSHNSHHGFGAYEINPTRVLVQTATNPAVNGTQDGQNIVSYRYGDSSYVQQIPTSAPYALTYNQQQFDPANTTLQDYAFINWSLINPSSTLTMPAGLETEPRFDTANGYEDNLPNPPSTALGTHAGVPTKHHSLYNPYFATESAGVGGRTLKLFDFRQTGYRYSGAEKNYSAPLYGLTASSTSFTESRPNHPANAARAQTTLLSNSLNRAGVVPNFVNINPADYSYGATGPLSAPAPSGTPQNFNPAVAPTAGNTDALGNVYRSLGSALAPVDLNRPLTDYRNDTTKKLSAPTNFSAVRAVQAHRDRHQLAQDIFTRFCLATGATTIQGNGKPLITIGAPNFNSLRYLAQLSVNIVDFIDNDDISTAFAWNPADPNNPAPEQDANNFSDLPNRVVFGVEKARLVLNEVYSEVTNDPADGSALAANQNFQVRFFIEVLNPGRKGSNDTVAPMSAHETPLVLNGTSTYRVQVYDDGNTVRQQLFDPLTAAGNVTGAPSGGPAKLSATMPTTATDVETNDGQISNTGFRQMYPQAVSSHPASDTSIFKPTAGAKDLVIPDGGGQNQLFYTVPKQQPNNIANNTMNTLNTGGTQGKHCVLLQRLANPYQPESPTNPFITVDTMFDIVVNDAIRVGESTVPLPLPPNGTRTTPPDPNANQQKSHGRRAPMYGFRGATATASYAVDQQRSFLSHNPNRLPQFDWLVHMDRKVISPLELASVAAVKPHELLHYFATSASGQTDVTVQPTQLQKHTAPFSGATANLARALDMLTVKPWMYGVPVGGRQPGKININAVWSKDVLTALLDPQGGNSFTTTEVDALWNSLIAGGASTAARTRSFPNVGTTTEEGNPSGDRPIKSFGVATFANAVAGNSLDETLLRFDPANGNKPAFLRSNSASQHPYQQNEMLRKAYNNLSTTTDTYMVIFTVGYFEIRATADNSTRFMPILGREVYDEIPGDLRAQFAAIVDRSMLALPPAPASGGTQQQAANVFFSEITGDPLNSANRNCFDPALNATQAVMLAFRATGGAGNVIHVNYEGQTIKIKASGTPLATDEVNTLVLGTGSSAVYIVIPPNATITPPGTNGLATIQFPANTLQPRAVFTNAPPAVLPKFYAGESVGSAVLGNPGPQGSFDPNNLTYKQVVRDFIRLQP